MRPENRLNLNYRAEAARFQLRAPITDVHSHINGDRAIEIYREAADLYGIGRVFSMTHLDSLANARRVLGDRLRLICIPQWGGSDPAETHGPGYSALIAEYAKQGAKVCKFWSAPRILDSMDLPFHQNPLRLTSPMRVETMKVAQGFGMSFMVHVADPDTWFKTKYRDSARYGTKAQHYELLDEMLSTFRVPTIAAHCGGYPEDLDFLDRLLARHSHLYLDLSATKWIVRELSKHTPERRRVFFVRWQDRLLFGSDIVTSDQHLSAGQKSHEVLNKATSETEAFDLYASRYWALRTLFESSFNGESPIADPDLVMVQPERYTALDAPLLVGTELPEQILRKFYSENAATLLK